MQKYIPVKTEKDRQSLTEFLNKGWIVKFTNKVVNEESDDEYYKKEIYNEYIISDEELINKPVETTNEQPKIVKYHFINDKKEYKQLYNLLSKVNSDRLSKKEEDDLEVFLERIAFGLG